MIAPAKLKKYLKNKGISQEAFGEMIGVNQGTVSKYCQGTAAPGRARALKIATVTHDLVPFKDWDASGEDAREEAVANG